MARACGAAAAAIAMRCHAYRSRDAPADDTAAAAFTATLPPCASYHAAAIAFTPLIRHFAI